MFRDVTVTYRNRRVFPLFVVAAVHQPLGLGWPGTPTGKSPWTWQEEKRIGHNRGHADLAKIPKSSERENYPQIL